MSGWPGCLRELATDERQPVADTLIVAAGVGSTEGADGLAAAFLLLGDADLSRLLALIEGAIVEYAGADKITVRALALVRDGLLTETEGRGRLGDVWNC